jgi:hypothetical protein
MRSKSELCYAEQYVQAQQHRIPFPVAIWFSRDRRLATAIDCRIEEPAWFQALTTEGISRSLASVVSSNSKMLWSRTSQGLAVNTSVIGLPATYKMMSALSALVRFVYVRAMAIRLHARAWVCIQIPIKFHAKFCIMCIDVNPSLLLTGTSNMSTTWIGSK